LPGNKEEGKKRGREDTNSKQKGDRLFPQHSLRVAGRSGGEKKGNLGKGATSARVSIRVELSRRGNEWGVKEKSNND